MHVGITTYYQRKTASQNCQKLPKLFPCRSYSGSCGIKTPTMLSIEVTKLIERPKIFNFFTIDFNRVDVWYGQCWCQACLGCTLLTLKSGRFQKTIDIRTTFMHLETTNKAFDKVDSSTFTTHRKEIYLL